MASAISDNETTEYSPAREEVEDGVSIDSTVPSGDITSAGPGPKIDEIKGSEKMRNQEEYDLRGQDKNKGDGVFIVVRNEDVNYVHNRKDWNKASKLAPGYMENISKEHIKKVFGLVDSEGKICGYAGDEGEGDEYTLTRSTFDDYIENMAAERAAETKKPGFLMFFLMAYGWEDGTFLLNGKKDSSTKGLCCNNKTEETKHREDETCHQRNFVKHIVQKFQEGRRFHGVPKIFIVQLIKDVHHLTPKGSMGGGGVGGSDESDADRFVPKGSDTFILSSCTEMYDDWKPETEGGAFLIKAFCKQVEHLKDSLPRSEETILKLHQALVGNPSSDTTFGAKLDELNTYFENMGAEEGKKRGMKLTGGTMTDGWKLSSIAQRTIATMAHFVKDKSIEMKALTDVEPNIFGPETEFEPKLIPIISSTLRWSLSMVKILKQRHPNL